MKPTAVRAKTENSLPNSTLINSSSNINNNTSAAASVAASQNSSINSKPSLISSTPSKNHHQPSAAQILAQNNSNNNSIQSPSTILPTAPIAFSAVAKQNPGEWERFLRGDFHYFPASVGNFQFGRKFFDFGGNFSDLGGKFSICVEFFRLFPRENPKHKFFSWWTEQN